MKVIRTTKKKKKVAPDAVMKLLTTRLAKAQAEVAKWERFIAYIQGFRQRQATRDKATRRRRLTRIK
jgi:hypothetical protein